MNKDFLKARVNGLKSISNALSNINIPHVIFDGALLGFIRERNLISWDWDAEIALHYRYFNANILKIIEVLEKCNLGKVIFNPSKKNPKLTIKLSKSEFGDFKYVITPYKLSKDSKKIYRALYHYPSKYLNELSKIEIDNFYFPIPKDYESLLKLQYGVNWKVPKRSNVKNDYLSNEVYTKSNNQINQFKTYILQVISKIINLSKNKIKNFLNKYPAFQYKFNIHREQLFIYQLASLINQNQYSKVIEIGSSDLSEYITLKSCFKNASFSDFIYEGLEETFELITEKVLKNYYKNITIYNKFVTPKKGEYYINNVKERNLISLSNDNFYKNKKKITNNIINFQNIEELKDNEVFKIIKMDIEGLEEEIFTQNLDFIKNTNRLSFVLETHQNKYKDPDKLFEALNSLIDYGYKIRFVELANFSNKKLLSKFLESNQAIKKHKGRILIKNPSENILQEICYCDYQLIDDAPYFASKNVRSFTLSNF